MENKNLCILCSKELLKEEVVVVKTKGLDSIINASKQRNDGLHSAFSLNSLQELCVHKECRRLYTHPSSIYKYTQQKTDDSRPTRSSTVSFDFKTKCLFCGVEVTEKEKARNSYVYPVRVLSFYHKIMDVCNERSDVWGAQVQSRLLSVIDLPAADAIYHTDCNSNFRNGQNIPLRHSSDSVPGVKGRPTDSVKSEAFEKLCIFLKNDTSNYAYSLPELVSKMEEYLPPNQLSYCAQYLQTKLQQYFGEDILFSVQSGRPTLVTLGKATDAIIRDFHTEKQCDDLGDEEIRLVMAAAKIIKKQIQLLPQNCDTYPSPLEISSCEENLKAVPNVLQCFVNTIITASSTEAKKAAIAQALLQAAKPRGFISPILLGLGVQLHRDHASRLLIDQLHRLGLCVSYGEVKRYLQCAITSEVSPLIMCDGQFGQFVADNVDHNVATFNGLQTFHGMGMIFCSSSSSTREKNHPDFKIIRSKIRLPRDMTSVKARTDIHFFKFHNSRSQVLNRLKFGKFEMHDLNTNPLDILWEASRLLQVPKVGWSGFMQSVAEGLHPGVCETTFLPLIDLDPTSYNCMYSTLTFICNEAEKLNIDVPVITFDQCLWMKATEVICSKQEEFQNIVIRLGGFHTLMSFLGAIGHLMSGSGIEEAMEIVFAQNTIPHIISGKAYSRSLRAHSLISCALKNILIENIMKTEKPIQQDSDILQSELSSEESLNFQDSAEGSCDSLPEDDGVCDEIIKKHQNYLVSLFNGLLSGDLKENDVLQSESVKTLSTLISRQKEALLETKNNTAKLWLLYLDMINVVHQFIRAERLGDFDLHLRAVENMLPLFASAGHKNYAKCARIYVQQMHHLAESHPDVYRKLSSGHFTIRRKDMKWAGVWTDMHIEQSLMRSIKSCGGLTRGGGMTESQRASWILSHPVSCHVISAMSALTGVSRTGSDQHVELSDSRILQDTLDIEKVSNFFYSHNPFTQESRNVVNIHNGLTDNQGKVNAFEAHKIGSEIQESMTEKTFSEVKMLKRNQVTTMNILRRGITIEGETQKIDHRLLTQRMLVLLALDRDSPNLADNFEYELAAVPMSLFDPSTGMMRKPDKASFAKSLDTKVSDRAFVKPKDTHYVLDGGALLQIIPWQHLEKYGDILKSYSSYITKHYGNATVVFDGYKSSTKDVEHGRRHKITSVDVAFDDKSPVLVNKTNFLANINNKQLFIDMLSQYLSQKGHKVLQAEADADILIVKTALLISSQEHVTVVADDTDVFVMLLKHRQKDICLQSAVQCNKLKDIPSFQEQLGKDACSILPFVHSLTGCDTTSSLFGRSKSVALKKILNSPVLFSYASAFGTKGLSVDALIGMGTKLLVELYGGKSDKHSLNKLRYELYIQKKLALLGRNLTLRVCHPQKMLRTIISCAFNYSVMSGTILRQMI